jgi:hypothetical protein
LPPHGSTMEAFCGPSRGLVQPRRLRENSREHRDLRRSEHRIHASSHSVILVPSRKIYSLRNPSRPRQSEERRIASSRTPSRSTCRRWVSNGYGCREAGLVQKKTPASTISRGWTTSSTTQDPAA